MPHLIISTVGTSLLTNFAARHLGGEAVILLRDTANYRERELTVEKRNDIDTIATKVKVQLKSAAIEELRRLSAELNGIYTYYGQEVYSSGHLKADHHVLIATDTYQALQTARLVDDQLRRTGFNSIEIMAPQGLSARDCGSFTNGVNEIVRWCELTLPGYRQQQYHIVFNLIGGFKSLQGYMNTLGMFYADEIIYIFEAPSAGLIRIPRLPVVMDEVPVLYEKAVLFALIENGYLAGSDEVKGVPEIYLYYDHEERCTLSTWGLLIWERNKRNILGGDQLFHFPALVYEKSFEKDFQSITDKDRRANIQNTLAKVSLLFQEQGLAGLRRHGGLEYENYKGLPKEGLGHFRLDRGWRVSCVPDSQVLRLRHVGLHDVNENP